MGQVLKVNGDYDIITADASTITLNTGDRVGTVKITGNLVVDGDSLTVSAENLNVQDNIIILNFGEVGNSFTPGGGISLRYSGIQIDRGNILPPASLVYDELADSWNFSLGTPESSFNYSTSRIRVKEVLTDSDTDNGDLILIGAGDGVVKVIGTRTGVGRADAYETRVTDPDDIPNKAYVDIAIQSNPTFQIRSPGTGSSGDTRVVALDVNSTYPLEAFIPPIGPYSTNPPQSEIAVLVDDRRIAVFRKNTIEFTGLTIFTEDPQVGDINAPIPGNPGSPISVAATVNGQSYRIVNPGNTNFILIGSPDNNIGTIFTASGPGTGTGTVQLITSDFEGQGAVVLQSDNTNANIKLETNGTGKVVITYALQMENNNITPAAVPNTTLVYAGPVAGGTSGLYTINNNYVDELVLRNRALLLSMIF
jgi:hypothetical protein